MAASRTPPDRSGIAPSSAWCTWPGRDEVWRLLVTITARKAAAQARGFTPYWPFNPTELAADVRIRAAASVDALLAKARGGTAP
jgi:hypothetical protein